MDINIFANFKPGQLITYSFDNSTSYIYLITEVTRDSLICRSLKSPNQLDYMRKYDMKHGLDFFKIIC